MKRVVFFIFAFVVAACGSKDEGGNKTAVSPLELSCINGTASCNNSYYNNYQNYGWMAYPGFQYGYNYATYFNQYGLCNCPSNYMPVYNGMWGLGCVRTDIVQPFSYYFWTFGPYSYPANEYPTNWPQYSNVGGGANPSTTSCTRTLAQSCFINQANSCGIGATCRQTTGGSVLGICVNN